MSRTWASDDTNKLLLYLDETPHNGRQNMFAISHNLITLEKMGLFRVDGKADETLVSVSADRRLSAHHPLEIAASFFFSLFLSCLCRQKDCNRE